MEMARGRYPRSAFSLDTGQIVSYKSVMGMEEGGEEKRMWLSSEVGRDVLVAGFLTDRCWGRCLLSYAKDLSF